MTTLATADKGMALTRDVLLMDAVGDRRVRADDLAVGRVEHANVLGKRGLGSAEARALRPYASGTDSWADSAKTVRGSAAPGRAGVHPLW